MEEWLKEHKFDRLCNIDIPCGCLCGDLAPCGEMHDDCRPGHREDVDDSLAYCKRLGYHWDGLYDVFDRVSCFCCPKAGKAKRRLIREHFPDLEREWQRLDAVACMSNVTGEDAAARRYPRPDCSEVL